jgi:predicted DNA-binding ribbon-helix-helix protein
MNPISSTGKLFRGRFVEQCRDRRARKSTLVALVGRLFLSAAGTETVSSFLRFATMQGIKRKQDLADLAPKDCFIQAKPVERVAWQIG